MSLIKNLQISSACDFCFNLLLFIFFIIIEYNNFIYGFISVGVFYSNILIIFLNYLLFLVFFQTHFSSEEPQKLNIFEVHLAKFFHLMYIMKENDDCDNQVTK